MKKPLILVLSLVSLFSIQSFAKSKSYIDLSTKDKLLSAKLPQEIERREFLEADMVPIGSSVLTNSGRLADSGIKGILHAASGSMTRQDGVFSPSLLGVKESVKNSLLLAKKKNYKTVAIPFIGSGIFLHALGMTKDELAYEIIKTALFHSRRLRITFVAYGEADYQIFKTNFEKAIKDYSLKSKIYDVLTIQKRVSKRAKVVKGSIINFEDHSCELIINAANTEIIFGGGLSGVIGRATGISNEIDQDAANLIENLKSTLKPLKEEVVASESVETEE